MGHFWYRCPKCPNGSLNRALNGAQTYLKFSITSLALPAAELHELTISDNDSFAADADADFADAADFKKYGTLADSFSLWIRNFYSVYCLYYSLYTMYIV